MADISQFDLSDWKNKASVEFENENGNKMYLLSETDDENEALYYEYVIPNNGVWLKVYLKLSANTEDIQVLNAIVEDVVAPYFVPLYNISAPPYKKISAGDIFSGVVGLFSGSAASIIDDFRYSVKANDYTDKLHRNNAENYDFIMAVYPNTGEPRLSAGDKLKYFNEYDLTTDEILAYRKECTSQIRKWIIAGCIGEGIAVGVNQLSKLPMVANGMSKFSRALTSFMGKNLSTQGKMAYDLLTGTVAGIEGFVNESIFRATMNIPEDAAIYVGNAATSVKQLASDALDTAAGNYLQNTINGDYGAYGAKKLFDVISRMNAMCYIENKYKYLMTSINNTKNNILNDYNDCNNDPDNPNNIDTQNPMLKNANPFKPVIPIIDPSGYVYEAVPSNRLENVKTTIYYMGDVVDDFGMSTGEKTPILWNAEDYDQSNLLFADSRGNYMWDVPEGSWQVKYEKNGYDTAYSEWLPVPPPQLDINQALVSTQAPEVLSINVYNDEVEVIFSKYMKLSAADKIKVMIGDREIIGKVSAANAEYNAENTEMYATIFKFKPEENISGDAAVTVESAEGYNSLASQSYSVTKTAVARPQYISAPKALVLS